MVKARELSVFLVTFVGLLVFAAQGLAEAPKPGEADKQTVLDLYVDAAEAAKWVSEKRAQIIDVRTPEEFMFVGHIGIAPNIPFKIWEGEFSHKDGQIEPKLVENKNFVREVQKRYKPDDTLIIMCRSGQRSAAAANVLVKEGFEKTYSMVDGLEGDKAKDGPNKGKRTVNGWKNAGNPWTYSLMEEIIWTPAK
jgi:rhodanese-related sulfurtransferase